MTDELPQAVRDELREAPRAQKRKPSRVRVRSDAGECLVLRQWADGFSVAVADAPRIRGRVDLYDGDRYLCQALVVASREEAGERAFEFKYTTPIVDTPQPTDYARDEDAPMALLPKV